MKEKSILRGGITPRHQVGVGPERTPCRLYSATAEFGSVRCGIWMDVVSTGGGPITTC